MTSPLSDYVVRLEALAAEQGLRYDPVDFEVVPPSFMTEVAVYGLPVRMPHWSFGVRYIYQLVQHRMGHSRLFEVVFPGNPNRAYLAEGNNLAENTLVAAHVLGHADFSKNNALFARSQQQVGPQIVELAAAHAHAIADAAETYGPERVEAVLDAALALEQYIDPDRAVLRDPYPTLAPLQSSATPDPFRARFERLPGDAPPAAPDAPRTRRPPVPPYPEHDLLWLIATYGPELEDWERDIFLAVRRESYYFYPVFACQIMNEGWASYWHATLLRKADFLPSDLYLDAIKTHSDVVRPYASGRHVALAINPYHVGFCMWERIMAREGQEAARRIMADEDDFGFIRNYLDEELAEDLELFRYTASANGEVRVREADIDALREAILAPRYGFGAPRVAATELRVDGTLVLRHDHRTDGRGLSLERAARVLDYLARVWRRPILLVTTDHKGDERTLAAGG